MPKDGELQVDQEQSFLSADQRKLVTESKDLSIRELQFQVNNGELILDPSFQRYYVFDDKKASLLIESVLMDVPLPLIYLSEEEDQKNEVIDGQQRLTSFMRFLNNKFPLKDLTVFSELNDNKYKALPKDIQLKFTKSTLRCIVIKRESHPEIKFDIFERLNSGSVKLNDQELRNCIYRGSYCDLLKELVRNADWLKLTGATKPHQRMADCEKILRFFAFYHSYHLYKHNIKQFLNNEMRSHQNISPEKSKELKKIFKQAVSLCDTVFGEQVFRRLEVNSRNKPHAKFEKKMNMSLFDIIMVGFTRYEKRDVIPRADAIRDKLYEMMIEDDDFIEAIKSTSTKSGVHTRFTKWLDALEKIIETPKKELRCFSSSFKQELYDHDSTCSICNQKIMSLDDSVVDHVIPYSLGGKTEPANGRLTHRYCNFARGNRN